jgi:Icc-related predicted phosphoesterase
MAQSELLPGASRSCASSVCSIRALLERRRFGIGLFGHIHESHHFSGSRYDRVGGTLVINPGGYHASDCCAAIFDSSKPDDWRGLWE